MLVNKTESLKIAKSKNENGTGIVKVLFGVSPMHPSKDILFYLFGWYIGYHPLWLC